MALRAASSQQEERYIRHVRLVCGGVGVSIGATLLFPVHPTAALAGGVAGAALGLLVLYRWVVTTLARKWSQEDSPRTDRLSSALYLAALRANSLDNVSRARIERRLVESDVNAGVFSLERLEVYRHRFHAQPDDAGPAFLLAAAYKQGWLPRDEELITVWTRILHTEWQDSPLWNRFNLSRSKLLEELANLIVARGIVSPEYVRVVEQAFAAAPSNPSWLTYLARAYPPRTDPPALKVYYAFFKHSPKDKTNTCLLADYVVEHLQGKPWEAEVLGAAVGLSEDSRPHYLVALAHCYARMPCFEEHTVPVYREAHTLQPEDKLIFSALALALARNEVYDEQAETIYTAAHKMERELASVLEELGADIAPIKAALAHCLAQRGVRTKSALSLYAQVFEYNPADVVIAAAYAKALLKSADYSQRAMKVYAAAYKSRPDDVELLIALAKAYAANGIVNHEATWIYQQVLHARQEWPGMYETLAELYSKEQRPPELALQLWKRLAEEQPHNAQVRKWIAKEYVRRREQKNALTYYQQAAQIAPDDFEAQFQTGKLLLEQTNDLGSALRAFQAAVALDPLHLEANLLLGETLVKLEVYPAALTVYEHVLDNIDNNNVRALTGTAQMKHFTDHDVLAAARLYERAVAIEPENVQVWKEFAELSKDHGLVERELLALETLTRLDPRESAYHVRLGELLMLEGDFKRAEEHLREAIALGAQGASVFTLLGEVASRSRRGA